MTLNDLLDQRIRRDLDRRYPYGWRVGFDEKGRLAILYVMPKVRPVEVEQAA
jgi:hypothetical protein